MSKYIIKNGSIVNRETAENVSSISGTLKETSVMTSESGVQYIHFSFGNPENADEEPKVLVVKKYGDASLKILKHLAAVADVLSGLNIEISLEEREGSRSLITVKADGMDVNPLYADACYSEVKKALTDRFLSIVRRSLSFNLCALAVLVPGCQSSDVSVLCDEISRLRAAGQADGVICKKTTFNDRHAADGYVKALMDFASCGLKIYTNSYDIESILAVCEQPQVSSSSEDDEEVEV